MSACPPIHFVTRNQKNRPDPAGRHLRYPIKGDGAEGKVHRLARKSKRARIGSSLVGRWVAQESGWAGSPPVVAAVIRPSSKASIGIKPSAVVVAAIEAAVGVVATVEAAIGVVAAVEARIVTAVETVTSPVRDGY